MQYLLIFLCTMTLTVQTVFKKSFGRKGISADSTYSGIVALFALVFFLVTGKNLIFAWEMIPYSLSFAVTYVCATVFNILALRWGSMAISSLIMSYSLVIPTLYGLIFLREPLGLGKLAGLCIFLVSLLLVRGASQPETKSVSAKWVIAIAIAFVCNGLCSVIQKAQQTAFDGIYNSSFMIVALGVAATASFIYGILFERKHLKAVFRQGFLSAALCGICNGATNYLVMVIVATVAASLFFPMLSAGQLVVTFALSVVLYKEKFLPRQLVGLGLGIAALVLLNL